MQVAVKFYGNYRRLIDASEVRLDIADDATPLDLVATLGERLGDKLRAALITLKEGRTRLQAGVRIAVGDEVIDFAGDLQRPLIRQSNGSQTAIRVFIFPPLMGGR